VRLLSYNIHKGVGGRDRLYRLQRIIDVIEHENPDLICLQEVLRDARRARCDDQPRMLADYFSLRSYFQLNVHYKRGGYGNQVLSRWPFRTKHDISLRIRHKKPRGAQILVLETPEGRLKLVNWHLGLAQADRRQQARRLLEHRLFRESRDLPTLITGDFNDWRNELDRAVFREHDLEQVTRPISRFRTFPAWMPVGALDKLFVRGPIEIRNARVVRTSLARMASDHLPLLVDFHLL